MRPRTSPVLRRTNLFSWLLYWFIHIAASFIKHLFSVRIQYTILHRRLNLGVIESWDLLSEDWSENRYYREINKVNKDSNTLVKELPSSIACLKHVVAAALESRSHLVEHT